MSRFERWLLASGLLGLAFLIATGVGVWRLIAAVPMPVASVPEFVGYLASTEPSRKPLRRHREVASARVPQRSTDLETASLLAVTLRAARSGDSEEGELRGAVDDLLARGREVVAAELSVQLAAATEGADARRLGELSELLRALSEDHRCREDLVATAIEGGFSQVAFRPSQESPALQDAIQSISATYFSIVEDPARRQAFRARAVQVMAPLPKLAAYFKALGV